MEIIQNNWPRYAEVCELICPDWPELDDTRSCLYPWTTTEARETVHLYDAAVDMLLQAATRWFAAYNNFARALQPIFQNDAFFFVRAHLLEDLECLAFELDFEKGIANFLHFRRLALSNP